MASPESSSPKPALQFRVDVVIPVLNEAHVLRASTEKLIAFLERRFPYDWRIVIADNGSGVPEELRRHIFEPFVTTKKGNLGMGLVVCRRIVESQGGQLTYEEPAGGGARFRIWLPACEL